MEERTNRSFRQFRQQLLYPRDVSRETFWILLSKAFVDLKRLGIFVASLLHPVLGAIKIPQVVERLRYIRQIDIGIFLCQLTANFERLSIFVTSLLHPV